MKTKNIIQISAAVILIAMLFFSNQSTTDLPEKYNWINIDNYNDAFRKTKSDKKPLIMYFHVDWCKYCKKLNETFLNNEDVYKYISNFEMVQINPEHGDKQKRLANKYGVKGYPTFLVTYPHNNKKIKIHPFRKGGIVWTIDKFIKKIKHAIGSVKK